MHQFSDTFEISGTKITKTITNNEQKNSSTTLLRLKYCAFLLLKFQS